MGAGDQMRMQQLLVESPAELLLQPWLRPAAHVCRYEDTYNVQVSREAAGKRRLQQGLNQPLGVPTAGTIAAGGVLHTPSRARGALLLPAHCSVIASAGRLYRPGLLSCCVPLLACPAPTQAWESMLHWHRRLGLCNTLLTRHPLQLRCHRLSGQGSQRHTRGQPGTLGAAGDG
jgi:hypothetical protein